MAAESWTRMVAAVGVIMDGRGVWEDVGMHVEGAAGSCFLY